MRSKTHLLSLDFSPKPPRVILATWLLATIGASIPPIFVGLMFANPRLINAPFFIAGTLKIAYDLLLYRHFVAIQPPEEEFQ